MYTGQGQFSRRKNSCPYELSFMEKKNSLVCHSVSTSIVISTVFNSDYPWLCDYSGYVSTAAAKVCDKFGISNRFGYVFEGGHPHCMACDSENDAVTRFIDKFLFNKPSDTNIRKADEFKDTDLKRWIGGWK